MKIVCDKTSLVDAVLNVSRAVSAKSTILALEGVLLRAVHNKLTLTGYDLELGITTEIDARVIEPGEIVLTARLFADMIRKLGHDRLGALHIHDNDFTMDQHLLPYLGKLDWADIAKALGEIDYQGDFTYEVNGLLFDGCDEGFVPIATRFMGEVGKHICSIIETNRPAI